jgi:2-beta-glucuronyltransferase
VPAAVVLTDHAWRQTSQLGVHFLSKALARRGWRVTFLTARYGPRMGLDAARLGSTPVGRLVPAPPLASSVPTPGIDTAIVWHRRRGSVLSRVPSALGLTYAGGIPRAIGHRIGSADLLLFDAGEPLAFYPQVRALNPAAALAFRMSDLPEVHPGSPEAALNIPLLLRDAGLIAVPSESMRRRYADLPTVRVVPHGLDLELFDEPHPSPYDTPGPHALFVGMMKLDVDELLRAARLRPDITFHVVGPFDIPALDAPNVRCHGAIPFERTIPFVTNADMGLQLISPRDGVDSFSRSLKMVQYTYCRLPIVAPAHVLACGPNVFSYGYGEDASLAAALDRALRFDRSAFVPTDVRSWDDVILDILRPLGLVAGEPATAAVPAPPAAAR